MVALLCAPCGSLSSDLTPCESGIAEDLWLFFNPSRYVVSFRPFTHPFRRFATNLCCHLHLLLALLHSFLPCLVLFLLPYSPTHGPLRPLVTSPPRLRPAHAQPGHVLTRPSRSRTRVTSPPWPAGYALHHGPESRSAAHVTAPTTPLMVTVTPGLVAVTSPPRPGPHTLPTSPAQPMETRHQAHGCPLTTPPARMSAAARPGPDPRRSTQLPAPTRPARPDPAHDEGTPPPLSPYTHARARSLCATRGFPIAGS